MDGTTDHGPLDALLDRCAAAAGSGDGSAGREAAALARGEAVRWDAFLRRAAVAEHWRTGMLSAIPAAAEALGEGWETDAVSFTDVTIAPLRLEGAPGRLGAPERDAARGTTVPVLVPPWETHSLPAQLAAHRIRASGRRADVLLGLPAAEAAAHPTVRAAPAILVSATAHSVAARLDAYTQALVRALRAPIPIILGGPGFTGPDAPAPRLPGRPVVATDPVLALRAIGLYDGSADDDLA